MKIGLVSLGCPKNLVDSEVMLGLARGQGHEITPDAAEADLLVVNTCAFIDRAKQESIDTILELAAHKQTGACRTLVVTGCLAERYRDELRAQIPEIDVVLGTGEVPHFAEVVGAAPAARVVQLTDRTGRVIGPSAGGPPAGTHPAPSPAAGPQARDSAGRPMYLYDADTPRMLATPAHYAYVKIAEGCNYTCAFCIIPTLRGPYRSRSIDSVVREAEALAARGVKELLLVSQDTSFYGVDHQARGELARLIRALDRVDGIQWIRMLYLYPTTIGDDLLDAVAGSEKMCRYIDLPLQHASDAVLRRMRRPGSRAAYERLLDRIRTRVPGVALRTTVIVGFPGETEADVAELQAFVQAVEFDHLGVFTYSHEHDTPAHALADDVPAREKRRRERLLMSQQRRIVALAHRRRIGQRVRLMVDGPDPEHPLVWRGRLESQAPEIDPVVYLTDCDPTALAPGQMLEVELVASRGYDLVAGAVEGAAPVAAPA
jgi:ribosomal protein S12 methylthiotransferase